MPLEHTGPTPALKAELREVARDASELMELLQRGLNIPLPEEFPRDQLIDICATLTHLPNGTAEGCRAPLEYARNRLPSIRQEHISPEGSHAANDLVLTRGTSLDQKLATLISSVSTALDAYRRLAAEEVGPDFEPEAGVSAPKAKVGDVVAHSKELDDKLGQAQTTISEIAQPGSVPADDLKRQFQDARGLSQLASAEVRMPRVVPGWLRKTVVALGRCPDIIRRTMASLNTGADIAEICVNRWHEFKHEGIQFLFEQFRKTTKAGERMTDLLEGKKVEHHPEPEEPSGAMRAVRNRGELQAAVRQSLRELQKLETRHPEIFALEGENTAHLVEQQRAVHQEKLLVAMRELAGIETYLALHRQYAVAGPDGALTPTPVPDPTLGRAGRGLAQPVFEQLIRMILRQVGRPMQSGEVVAAFAERGIPLGGTNPGRTAWNRLWRAKTSGVLDHHENLGYWLHGVPLPGGAVQSASVPRGHRRKLTFRGRSPRRADGPPGRKRILSEIEVELARKWLLSGKSMSEVCADLGGITPTTLSNSIPGGIAALRQQYPHLAKPSKIRKRKAPAPGNGKPGRRPLLDANQVAEVKSMREKGMSVPYIADKMEVSEPVIYRILGGIRKRAQSTEGQ